MFDRWDALIFWLLSIGVLCVLLLAGGYALDNGRIICDKDLVKHRDTCWVEFR